MTEQESTILKNIIQTYNRNAEIKKENNGLMTQAESIINFNTHYTSEFLEEAQKYCNVEITFMGLDLKYNNYEFIGYKD